MRRYNDNLISLERLREFLSYSPETGEFTWKKSPGARTKAGTSAGKLTREGYVRIGFQRICFPAHRLAWAMCYGAWPDQDLDHINRIKSDNRIANLRLASQSQNNANQGMYCTNTSGAKGVTRLRYGSWQAQIQVDGKCHYLGAFRQKTDAIGAYAAAAKQFFGEFSSAGAPP